MPKDLNKIYQLFARIPCTIAILKNPSKDDHSDSKENAHGGKLVDVIQLHKKTFHYSFLFYLFIYLLLFSSLLLLSLLLLLLLLLLLFLEFGAFYQKRHKGQLKVNSSEHIK